MCVRNVHAVELAIRSKRQNKLSVLAFCISISFTLDCHWKFIVICHFTPEQRWFIGFPSWMMTDDEWLRVNYRIFAKNRGIFKQKFRHKVIVLSPRAHPSHHPPALQVGYITIIPINAPVNTPIEIISSKTTIDFRQRVTRSLRNRRW